MLVFHIQFSKYGIAVWCLDVRNNTIYLALPDFLDNQVNWMAINKDMFT